MEAINQVVQRAENIMATREGMNSIKLPALREVIENVAATKNSVYSYGKHSDHTKSSTKGCSMGCLGG